MKSQLKSALVIALTLAITTPALAGGIPVIDGAAIATAEKNSLAELAQMAKQLAEAKAQLEQLKASVKAMTGDKGFTEILNMGGIDPQITGTLEDLMKGNTSGLTAKAKAYLDSLPDCGGSRDKAMCEQAHLGGVAQLDFAEKLHEQLNNKLRKITELSEKAKSATDMKSMAEIQAQIQLEGNSIAVLQQQADNFAKMQDAKQQLAAKQAAERNIQRRVKAISNKTRKTNSSYSDTKYSTLLK
ncbi:type IV secretion system protein [uncultured Cardiobacterium sp.]|uniref:type IV secretion system protein n=1 Tax=uncultured Cardiobacterium sp. TaxID=417619 RepID=UPI002611C83A|nr:type IV secretion system protein [uncultured Cardiobacterium sp.]